MYEWFVGVQLRNTLVYGPMIEQKAEELAFLLIRKDFQGGSDWLQQSKERHETASENSSIVQVSVSKRRQ